ncbi:MAG TPA: MBL fold metallo-hydrolase [Polyangiaceae bacterium]|nr:MBL fold metallo-hydrolase [Polyangiaceae bacterium]
MLYRHVLLHGVCAGSVCLMACSPEQSLTPPGDGRVPAPASEPARPDASAPSPDVDASAPGDIGTAPGAAPAPAAADAGGPDVDAGSASRPDAAAAPTGSLDVTWMHGAASCAQSTDPELQLHAYDATTYILRQDKCRTFEAPFVYLLLGSDTALLLDTGATQSPALRDTVAPLVGARALLVAHTHAHGDHVASDARFAGQPSTTVVGTSRAAVQAAFGIASWPTDTGELDLGGRVLDVLAIPGHEATHIALYDRNSELLFTGDSLYPGLLFINDWAAYRASMRRLAEFVAAHPVSHVLGAHVEMTATPGVSYPYGTIFQPEEHALPLEAAHVLELDAALDALGPAPPTGPVAHADFVIDPQ